jgi:hypothetical protein
MDSDDIEIPELRLPTVSPASVRVDGAHSEEAKLELGQADMQWPVIRWLEEDPTEQNVALRYKEGTPNWKATVRKLKDARPRGHVIVISPTTRDNASDDIKRARLDTYAGGGLWQFPQEGEGAEDALAQMANYLAFLERRWFRLPDLPKGPNAISQR